MASRLNASYVSILQRSSDVIAIYAALYVVSKINQVFIDQQTLLIFFTVISVFQLIGGLTDFYRSWRGIGLVDELFSCFKNVSLTIVLSYLLTFFYAPLHIFAYFQFSIFLILFISILRIFIRILYISYYKFFQATNSVLVIGDSVQAKKLYQDLCHSEWTGSKPLGLFSFQPEKVEKKGIQGSAEDVILAARGGLVSKVYIVLEQTNLQQAESLVEALSDTTCSVVIVPEILPYNFLYSRVEDINGTPVIPLFDTRLNGINTLLKRIEDICVGSAILLMISPILLLIAIAIKLNSKGPVFFKQIRYGLNGKPIMVYKFRTMTVMENGAEVKQAVKDDPRVTKVGKFLRRTSLDELPQFINVIQGNMSVVGPRPHAVAHNEEYRKLIPGYMLRHKVKPGITGLAQIRGWRGETDTLDKMEKRIECDLEYIRSWSLSLDIKIIFFTVFKGFIHKAAY